MKRELMATATFGLEACVKREIQALGYEIIGTENGHVAFLGDERAIARCNLWLRCADRVLLVMGQFPAETFEDLFQQTKGIAWEELIPPDGKFTVIGSSVKSRLHSVPACQSIVKKAVAERLGECLNIQLPAHCQICRLAKEVLTVIDTAVFEARRIVYIQRCNLEHLPCTLSITCCDDWCVRIYEISLLEELVQCVSCDRSYSEYS